MHIIWLTFPCTTTNEYFEKLIAVNIEALKLLSNKFRYQNDCIGHSISYITLF